MLVFTQLLINAALTPRNNSRNLHVTINSQLNSTSKNTHPSTTTTYTQQY